ncbi:hypothetical protein AMS68_007619 [Peltaster fructicola]|uniref:NADP-dependent oxidoreductase domain-containing protein n=1 Tax=Peltaster fructicola TaxID=286661 RepID=A0A6H0Y4Y7_9PEZI|nr:hypothetical protein AMS68_007619 [Peltaster fructicola]
MAQQILNSAKSALGLDGKKTYTLAGESVGSTGFGLMGMTWRPNPQDRSKSIETMKAALKAGANFWNGGEFYGPPEANSLHLLNEYFTKYPEDASKVVISIKGGGKVPMPVPDGSEKNTQRSIDECLRVLDGKKKLDLFECARVDPKTPVEITMRAIKKYIDAGKLGGVCLSECSADTIRRAAKEVKISGVEIEYSLWATDAADNGVFAACAELDIPIIAYSPLGRGFLTGQLRSPDDIPEDDFRRGLPRFQKENFDENLKLVAEVESLAKRKGATAGQVALSWVKAQSERNGNPVIIPIPGTTTVPRLEENMADVELSENDIKEIDSMIASFTAVGTRYGGPLTALEYGDSPALSE